MKNLANAANVETTWSYEQAMSNGNGIAGGRREPSEFAVAITVVSASLLVLAIGPHRHLPHIAADARARAVVHPDNYLAQKHFAAVRFGK
ncbi:hypothetical protein BKG77_09960 [Mycobacteroides chelonae]|uniref:hypothetical protein n=1 Tax=Mycobacteroides chelonae TaxID=1774 RepID=UPI0008A8F49B|nr:hypothetical protein [Mycobacteroides chelonae]OHU23893.1 hypothetical protein BKG77_09960 [Mycobacteroides chelonae]